MNIEETQKTLKMTLLHATSLKLANRYLNGLLDPTISLLEIHKLLYFMQEAGEPLRLNFKKHIYGPYSENLRHVLNAIEGHFISGYEDGGDSPEKQIEFSPKAVKDASIFLKKHESTQNNFNKVNKLVDGFETSYGLELLSTVHWVVKNENVSDFDEITEKIYSWNKRKQQFTKRQIKIALDVLKKQNWIS